MGFKPEYFQKLKIVRMSYWRYFEAALGNGIYRIGDTKKHQVAVAYRQHLEKSHVKWIWKYDLPQSSFRHFLWGL